MDWVLPIVSFVGSIAVGTIASVALFFAGAWVHDRHRKKATAEVFLDWGMSIEEIDELTPADPEWEKIIDFILEDTDPKKFSIRAANFMGSVWTVFRWFTYLVGAVLLIGTVTFIVQDGEWPILYFWWGYPLWILIEFGLYVIYSQITILLTGHGPGQPKILRKDCVEYALEQKI